MTDDANDGAPRSALLRLVRGLWVSRALWVAAKLGIADLLSEGSRSGAELAAATATHAPSLRRVLRVLCGARVLVQDDAERFGLTPVGALLRSGTPDSLRAWTTMALGDEYYQAWGALMQTVRTGDVAFDHVFGDDVWMYRASHAEHAALFDAAMASHSGPSAADLLASYSFARFTQVVDVGGGDGAMVEAVLRAGPKPRGVVFDLPHVAVKARERMRTAHLADRCDVIGGNMFESVPGPGDVYLLSSVLHDWADGAALAILRNCRQAMEPGGTLVVFERTLAEAGGDPVPRAVLADLLMMVMYGGRERTEAEYRALLAASGFRHTRTVPTAGGLAVMEAVREGGP